MEKVSYDWKEYARLVAAFQLLTLPFWIFVAVLLLFHPLEDTEQTTLADLYSKPIPIYSLQPLVFIWLASNVAYAAAAYALYQSTWKAVEVKGKIRLAQVWTATMIGLMVYNVFSLSVALYDPLNTAMQILGFVTTLGSTLTVRKYIMELKNVLKRSQSLGECYI